jgi:hypothetical protein
LTPCCYPAMMEATSNGSGTLLRVTIRNTGCDVGLTHDLAGMGAHSV